MTVAKPRTRAKNAQTLTSIREAAEPALGNKAAERIRRFRTGGIYVGASAPAAFIAWLIDFLLIAGVSVGIACGSLGDFADEEAVLSAIGIFVLLSVLLPFLYGWFFRDGRALGGLLTGTRLVRIKDGSRVGWWKAGWAMFIRSTLVLMLLGILLALLDTDGPGMFDWDASQVRTSIDIEATEKLSVIVQRTDVA
ncbi:RDD family protein [Glutamicibacter uratoxydans]|uniref:RDD family protein n=1 Tax=Glutamicibacter uratoxydans TaxID=43667 RepID=UPI001144DDBE|nr:RDD family protein [Glutamicibacter uratoxydans]